MRRPAFEALDRQWAFLTRSPEAARAAAHWADDCDLSAVGLAELVARTWAADPAAADHTCAALARRAPTDEFAARTLLQILRPGLRALGRRMAVAGRVQDIDSELLSLAWERIRTYPIDRRPRHIAANVLLDVRKRYIRALTCRDSSHDSLEHLPITKCGAVPSAEYVALEATGPSLQRAHARLVSAVRAGRITPTNASIVWRRRVQEQADAEIADALGLEVRALQRRRQRTERRLAMAS